MSLTHINEAVTVGPPVYKAERLASLFDKDSCPQQEWRNIYNQEVAALTREVAHVSEQLASINKMRDEVSRAVWQGSQALERIQKRLAACPPAMPPGMALPIDMFPQKCRPMWRANLRKPLDDGIDIVLANYIPQAKKDQVSFNQFVPAGLLNGLLQYQGKNNSVVFILKHGRSNSRASEHNLEGTGDIYGDALVVPSPLIKEKWMPLVIDKPCLSMADSKERLHNLAIFRFTIDTLQDGSHLLSFSNSKDQLMATMALKG